MEERRRLWWAVLILDRYVHIGLRFRPLCTPKIPPDEILPARDAAWDLGVSSPTTVVINRVTDVLQIGVDGQSAAGDEHRSIHIRRSFCPNLPSSPPPGLGMRARKPTPVLCRRRHAFR